MTAAVKWRCLALILPILAFAQRDSLGPVDQGFPAPREQAISRCVENDSSPRESPRIEVAGCSDVVSGSHCEFEADIPLAIWIEKETADALRLTIAGRATAPSQVVRAENGILVKVLP